MNGWPFPKRPGVPLNPDKPDWHAILADDSEFAAVRWTGKMWGLGVLSLPSAMMAGSTYLGRLLPPAEVASQIAAARREALEEAAALIECGCANRHEVVMQLPNSAARWNLCGHPRCMMIKAAAIRALAEKAPGND